MVQAPADWMALAEEWRWQMRLRPEYRALRVIRVACSLLSKGVLREVAAGLKHELASQCPKTLRGLMQALELWLSPHLSNESNGACH